jgi:hypothetical protein
MKKHTTITNLAYIPKGYIVDYKVLNSLKGKDYTFKEIIRFLWNAYLALKKEGK